MHGRVFAAPFQNVLRPRNAVTAETGQKGLRVPRGRIAAVFVVEKGVIFLRAVFQLLAEFP